ncbi:hypothetical protein GIB67_026360 [Kingdonia uniflora]|uniref:Peptidase S8/S53 domain-containing protein n=1 Tax=Kingdonia uniflora TaxID=39325 RepID=A0A7J7P6G4_9MAGN|nr:hypothetical protein GIB67_026360 [Kingdonia uniflora]
MVCDTQKKYVIGLLASGLDLSGLIPESTIGKLNKLQSLDLSNNKITGFSSDFWSLGRSFKTLNLSYNQIFGSLPSNIGNFGGWESLDLSFNSFSGVIPASFSSLSGLQVLKLDGNGFGGSIPVRILKCQNLVSVSITSNQITGTVPDGFNIAFPKLKNLDISGNAIQGRSLDISGMKSITYLNISMNMFKGFVMGVFEAPLEVNANSSFNWSHLVYLDLSENQLSGESFHDLNDAHNLKHLNLAHNRFSQQEFPEINVKVATSVPVVIFEKPLLNFTFSDLLYVTSNFKRGTLLAEERFEPVYKGFLPGGARGTADEMDIEFLGENMRYATKSKLVKSPGKLSVSPLPRDDSVPMRNAPHFVSGSVPMPVPALPENKMTRFEGESQSTTEKGKRDVRKAPSFSGPLMLPNKASSNSYSAPIRSSRGQTVKLLLLPRILENCATVETASERERLLLQKISKLQTRMININDELTAEKLKHMRPNISALGVDILAAWSPLAPPSDVQEDKRSMKYNIISRTSMACPHVIGATAYIKTFHPDWSPSAIKYALMTTAIPVNSSRNLDAKFSYGADVIDPVKAINPGLVYDIVEDDLWLLY